MFTSSYAKQIFKTGAANLSSGSARVSGGILSLAKMAPKGHNPDLTVYIYIYYFCYVVPNIAKIVATGY